MMEEGVSHPKELTVADTPIDDASVPIAEAVSDFDTFHSPAPPQNLGLAVLKRWPWLLVGVAGGLVIGLLYHTQRQPIYQSNAQLLVIKNRPEMISGQGDSKLAFVEDYVTTQVTLLRSQAILSVAANKLQDGQFQNKPPASENDRMDFMMNRFGVIREREPGSNTFTNVLALTFRSASPGDSAEYLRTIIDAYRAQLASIYEEASTKEAEKLEKQIFSLDNEVNILRNGDSKNGRKGINDLTREIEAITREDVSSLRTRLTGYVNDRLAMQKRLATLNRQVAAIQAIGPNRPARLDLLSRLGQQPRQQAITSLDSRNPQDVLFSFNLQRTELAQKFGKDHPEIQALDGRIRMLEKLINSQTPEDRLQLDELAVFGRTLELERDALADQIGQTTSQITDDEQKIDRVSRFLIQRDDLTTQLREKMKTIEEKKSERNLTLSTRSTGGYKVEDITKPSDGIQVSPILLQSILFGLILGVVAGGALALAVEMTDRSFRSPADIRQRLGLPILGHIPRLKLGQPNERESAGGMDPALVSYVRPSSTEAEAYRGVRTQLYFSTQGRGHQVIQVTSPNPGDGKSTLAANLAISIAQSGKRVVLLDCDFRKPRVHKIFKLTKPDVGLASVMGGNAPALSAVQPSEVENLFLLPCGPRPANPAELLTTPRFSDVLRELRERFDFVIVDTPPILAVSDPSAVAARVDGVLLVFRMTKNARPVSERAREQLSAVGARVLGIVVNASSSRSAGYGGYGYSYQYQYEYAEHYADTNDS